MKLELTEAARADLDDILAYTKAHFPFQLPALERRFRAVFARIADQPESARRVEGRPGVRVVPLIRYPFKVFYRFDGERAQVLHIHHAARAMPEF